MGSVAREARSWLLATLDFVFAFVGVGAVAYPTLWFVGELAGATVPRGIAPLASFALAFGASYPYVAGDWSLGRLGEFLFVTIASALAWGALVGGVVLALDLSTTQNDPAPVATAWTLALATAYGVVYWRKIRLFQ